MERRFSIQYRNISALGTNKLFLETEIEKIEEFVNEIEDEDIGLSRTLIERVTNISEVLEQNQESLNMQEYNRFSNRKEKIHSRLK